jgi:hypothetical protein
MGTKRQGGQGGQGGNISSFLAFPFFTRTYAKTLSNSYFSVFSAYSAVRFPIIMPIAQCPMRACLINNEFHH